MQIILQIMIIFSLWGNGVEVSQGEYTISSKASGLNFTVTSTLNVTAVKSSRVDCLASVSALPAPLMSSVHLTVGKTVTQHILTLTLT